MLMQMLRYIDIDKDGKTTIERFALGIGNLWLAKRVEKESSLYGVSLSKQDALDELGSGASYAKIGVPEYLHLPGNQILNEKNKVVFSLPGAAKFAHSLLTFELKQQYSYSIYYCEDNNSVILICKPNLNKAKSYFVLHTNQGIIPDQIRRCIYQLYIEYDKGIDFDLTIKDSNIKKREWLAHWTSRLPARGFSL